MKSELFSFLEKSLTPFHACQNLAEKLTASGFVEIDEKSSWRLFPGKGYFFRRGQSALAAFVLAETPSSGWKIGAAHTDSPGWRLKLESQKKDPSGVVRIGIEVYGAPIHSTWLDRDLAVAGRVFVRTRGKVSPLLVCTPTLAVLPNLAIHYNREVNKGTALDLQSQQVLAALGTDTLQQYLAKQEGFESKDFIAGDLFVVDRNPVAALGEEGLFLSPRIDNLTGCHAVLEGLLGAETNGSSRLAVFFDQEEVGSSTWTGADSSLLSDLLDRLNEVRGGSKEDLFRAKAASFLVSVDSAHGIHPNFSDRHDPAYAPILGRGPVLKASSRFSYATTAETEARLFEIALIAGAPLQKYIMRSDLVPGSTVGPITTSWSGIAGVDVGIPIWAMHSVRETAHLADQDALIKILKHHFEQEV